MMSEKLTNMHILIFENDSEKPIQHIESHSKKDLVEFLTKELIANEFKAYTELISNKAFEKFHGENIILYSDFVFTIPSLKKVIKISALSNDNETRDLLFSLIQDIRLIQYEATRERK